MQIPSKDLITHPDDLPFVRRMIKALHPLRDSLELSILYAIFLKVSSLIVKGRSAVFVSDVAGGKGAIIKSTFKVLKNFKEYESIETDGLSQIGIIDYLKYFELDNANLEVMIEDLSVVFNKNYLIEDTLNVISKLIADRRTGLTTQDMYRLEVKGKKENWTIKINSLCCLFGATNSLQERIERIPAWDTMHIDRISRYFLFATRAQDQRIDDNINFDTTGKKIIMDEEVNKIIAGLLPNKPIKIPDAPLKMDISQSVFRFVYENLYKYQHSKKRGSKYFKGDLSALAILNGDDTIQNKHLAFFLLYYPNLYLARCSAPNIRRIAQHCTITDNIYDIADNMRLPVKEIMRGYYDQEEINKYANPVYIRGNRVTLWSPLQKVINRQEEFIEEAIR
jgi:hypothetical protein